MASTEGAKYGKSSTVPVFRPTLAEMEDFPAYIRHMESENAHRTGLAKVS